MPEERLQKILAQAGIGSRRANEELITQGRVTVNGKVAELGSKADPQRDTIAVDGRAIPKAEALTYIALHKPRNVLSDIDPQDPRPTVRDLVPVPGHLFAVGRLDFDSEGLILLTNDGDLANKLTHPRFGHEKEYRVLIGTRPDEQQLTTWRRGVVLEDGVKTAPAMVEVESTAGKGTWLRVILREGRKRQIREVGKTIGLPVVRILRVRIGTLLLGNLKPKEWRYLTPHEVASLKGISARETRVRRQDFPPRKREGSYAPRRERPDTKEKAGGERSSERRGPSTRRGGPSTGRPASGGRDSGSTPFRRERPAAGQEMPTGGPSRPAARRDRADRPKERPERPSGGSQGTARRRGGPAQPRRSGPPRKNER